MAQVITCISHISGSGLCGVWGQRALHTIPGPLCHVCPNWPNRGVFIFVGVGAVYSAFIGPPYNMYAVT